MNKRIISILAATTLLVSLAACGNQDTVESTGDTAESTTGAATAQPNSSYTGTVSAISTSSITVSTEDGDLSIELTDDTTFSREFGMGEMPSDMGQMGSMEEMPSDMGQMGSMEEMPSDMGQMGGMEEMPSDMGEMGSMEEMPSDMGQMGGETPPEKPDGESDLEGTPPELPEGEAANGGNQPGTPPDMPQGEMGGQMQSLTVADISLGDTVTVETDDLGKALSVTISGGEWDMPMPGGNMGMPGDMASAVDSWNDFAVSKP